MKLFSVKKVGVFLDQVSHATERRPDGEQKVLILHCRVQPFDAKLATAVADVVRQDLFALSHPDAKPELRRVEFALGVPRQQLHIFASPDTVEPTLLFDQCKIAGTYARTEKGVNMLAFCFKASFGPPSKQELEYAEEWRLGQRFVSFEPAEPGLFDDADQDEEPDAEDTPERPRDMWDDGDEVNPQTAAAAPAEVHEAPERARRTPRRHADRKKAARAKQAKGRKRGRR